MTLYEFPSSSSGEMCRLDFSHYERDCVVVALERKLFDIINDEGGLSKDEIIKKCGFGTRGGNAVINLLCAISVASNYLVSSSPFYYGPMLTLQYGPRPQVAKAFELDASEKHESDLIGDWEEGKIEPELADRIAATMHACSITPAISFAKNINLGKLFNTKTMLDVGGGSGCYSIATSIHQPGIKTIVLDLPYQCKAAEKYINNAKNLPPNSVLTYGCNWFKQPFPKHDDPKYGYDTLFMSNILHDWDEKTRKFLCQKAYDSLPSNGTILIHEALFNDDESDPLNTAYFSFHMFVYAKGKQFTFEQLKDLLTSCGFEDVNTLNTNHEIFSVVSARKLKA